MKQSHICLGVGILFGILGFVSIFSPGISMLFSRGNNFTFLYFILPFILWWFAGLIMILSTKSCPYCGRVLVRRKINRELLDSSIGYKTVTRKKTNRNGDVISQWDEQVSVKRNSYKDTYECKHCKKMWSLSENEEHESF